MADDEKNDEVAGVVLNSRNTSIEPLNGKTGVEIEINKIDPYLIDKIYQVLSGNDGKATVKLPGVNGYGTHVFDHNRGAGKVLITPGASNFKIGPFNNGLLYVFADESSGYEQSKSAIPLNSANDRYGYYFGDGVYILGRGVDIGNFRVSHSAMPVIIQYAGESENPGSPSGIGASIVENGGGRFLHIRVRGKWSEVKEQMDTLYEAISRMRSGYGKEEHWFYGYGSRNLAPVFREFLREKMNIPGSGKVEMPASGLKNLVMQLSNYLS